MKINNITYDESDLFDQAKVRYAKNTRLTLVRHPHLSHVLALMRDINTLDTHPFSEALKLASTHVILRATKNLLTRKKQIVTPLSPMLVEEIEPKIVFAPILRAALGMHDAAKYLFPKSATIMIAMHRDESSAKAVWEKPLHPISHLGDGKNTHIFILDTMLATGGSAVEAVKALQQLYPLATLDMVSIIAAPVGIDRLLASDQKLHLTVAGIDDHLNEQSYIIPGLGDAGDRQFGTT